MQEWVRTSMWTGGTLRHGGVWLLTYVSVRMTVCAACIHAPSFLSSASATGMIAINALCIRSVFVNRSYHMH